MCPPWRMRLVGAVVAAWLNGAGLVVAGEQAAQAKGLAEAGRWGPASGKGGPVGIKVGSGESAYKDLPPPPP